MNVLSSLLNFIGNKIGSTSMGTTATTLTGAIAEVKSGVDSLTSRLAGDFVVNGQLQSKSGSSSIPVFATDTLTYDNILIQAQGNSGSLSLSVAKTGYKPVAIKGIRLNNATQNGQNAANCCVYAWALGTSALSFAIHNHTELVTANVKLIVDVMYIASPIV